MSTIDVKHRGLAILPEVFGRPVRLDPIKAMPSRYWMILLAVLVPPPLLALHLRFIARPDTLAHEHLAHMLVEGFCALIALVVFYILRQEWTQSGGWRLGTMAHGFLLYGILNLAHAGSPGHLNSFVFLHSIAGFALAISMVASVVEEGPRLKRFARLAHERRLITLAAAAAGIAIALAGAFFAEYFPWRYDDGSFTVIASGVNSIAAALFAFSGWIFMRDFCRGREPILFSFGLCMLAFAETHALFPLSRLWDIMWWAWHAVKLCIFLGLLFGIAYECAQTLNDLFGSNQALQRSHLALERRNNDIQSAYEQLASTQASLVRVERLAALGQMAAIIAHEIRNPLATITNCIGILKRPHLTVMDTTRALALAEGQLDRIDQIVGDTLNAVRAQVVRWQPVSLGAIIKDLVAFYQSETLGKVQLTAEIPDDLPFVDGIPKQLHQMLWNLVINAAEALDGHGAIRLRAYEQDASVVIEVTDTGPGVPEDLLDRVFAPLFTTKSGGMGMGLAVVRNIATEHGGAVEIRPASTGACVIIRLPSMMLHGTENRQVME